MNLTALLLTLLSGLFFALGFLIVRFVKNKKSLTIFANSMAFVILMGMLFKDLLPEIIALSENVNATKSGKISLILFFIILGMGILKVFDLFLPHHSHHHKDNEHNLKEHNNHNVHIGIIMSLSLILHNILEGMSLYIIAKESWTSGLLMALGVGFHNLPLGIEIASNLTNFKNSKQSKMILLSLILSSFVGGLMLFVLSTQISDLVLLSLISIACGMIIYLALFELLKEIFNYLKNKFTYFGIGVGIVVLLLMTFME